MILNPWKPLLISAISKSLLTDALPFPAEKTIGTVPP